MCAEERCQRSGVRLVPICFITSRGYTLPALKLGRLSYVSLNNNVYFKRVTPITMKYSP